MYTYTYVYIYAYIYICIYILYTYIYMHTYIYVYMHIYIWIHIYIYIWIHIYICIFVYGYVYIYRYVYNTGSITKIMADIYGYLWNIIYHKTFNGKVTINMGISVWLYLIYPIIPFSTVLCSNKDLVQVAIWSDGLCPISEHHPTIVEIYTV